MRNQSRKQQIFAGVVGLLGVIAVGAATEPATGTSTAVPAVADDPGVHLEADLSERRLRLMIGDSIVHDFGVAVGKGSKPTPLGNYKIRKIIWNPAWIPPDEPWAKGKTPEPPGAAKNPMKLVKIFFQEPDYYIHGTDEVESIGEAASHGCLRMNPDDAYRVARFLMEHGGQPEDESWFDRVLHFRSETKTVILSHPIPLLVAA